MSVLKKTRNFRLAMPSSERREKVFNESGVWIDTKPIKIDSIRDPFIEHFVRLIAVKESEETCDTESEFCNDEKNE